MENKERPVFIPPRKRISKKVNGVQNYVDHIVSIQVSTYVNINILIFIQSKLK